MVNCAVQWCKNSSKGNSTSKLEGRTFLRFHTLPKDSAIAKKWKVRMGRRPQDVTATMAVCSDHFNNSDYKDYLRAQLMSHKSRHIILNNDAVPNTDPGTGEMRSQDNSPCVTGRSKKRVRRDATSVDSFIAEQEAILGTGQASAAPDVVDDQLPGTEPAADEPDQPVPRICICNTQRRAASTQTELR